MRFGVVGIICFGIDFGIYTALNFLFRSAGVDEIIPQYYLVSQFVSFVISTICNYILSFRFVFRRRNDISRRRQFITFFILSAVGLLINEVVLFIGMHYVYTGWAWLHALLNQTMAETVFKLFATAVVMVYNFFSRKIFLEDHSAEPSSEEKGESK